jgi:hypothetical protein
MVFCRYFRYPGPSLVVSAFLFVCAAGQLKENDNEQTGPIFVEDISGQFI